jgi:ADP-heptose:LPS heptosyltransferase
VDDIQNFQNICIIDLGQLGDVLLSFPAILAIRKRFPTARITVIAGKIPAQFIGKLGLVDDVMPVDRVALLRGNKFRSIGKIFKLVAEVRRRKFDLVIDLHSLSESNLLGFLSGARTRLFADRFGRSLNWLSNFRPLAPTEDKSIHLTDNYLAVLRPLGIDEAERFVKIDASAGEAGATAKTALTRYEHALVGMVIGAGHTSRRWPLERFAELARTLVKRIDVRIAVFLGPEEEGEADEVEKLFPEFTTIVTGLDLVELAAAFSKVDLVVSNDTGPPHLAALVGTPIVLIIDERGPLRYLPMSRDIEVVRSGIIDNIAVEEVLVAVEKSLSKKRGDDKEYPEKDQADQRKQH